MASGSDSVTNSSSSRLGENVAWITGGGGGIGRASALRLASEGASVLVTDVNLDEANETVKAIRDLGGIAESALCDVTLEDDVNRAAKIASTLGSLKIVVASAGISMPGSVHTVSLRDWELVLAVNLSGAFLTCKHAIPYLVSSGGGSIITIGSISSVVAGSGSAAASYKASKGGLLMLTRQIAIEYADSGIRANCICPGPVDTELGERRRLLAEERGVAIPNRPPRESITPLGRLAQASEIAASVSFLASNESAFITGTAFMVDGGHTAR
jgi:NAD(P)-dependent dehydrogenase (short-subunit alcohol dehydrogenase family)